MKLQTLYEIRMWDNCDKGWVTVSRPTDKETADAAYKKITKNGTQMTETTGKDYYKIFVIQPGIKIKKV